MKSYKVEMTRTFEVKAKNPQEAINKAKDLPSTNLIGLIEVGHDYFNYKVSANGKNGKR